jgi:D-alanine-D-alanine ligase
MTDATGLRITVFLGGTSSERDVSLASGIRITEALRRRGHLVVAVDPAHGPLSAADEQVLLGGTVVKTVPPSQAELRRMTREALPRLARNIPLRGDADVVFLGLHGGYGEDGTIQAMLDLAGIPYTGSGIVGSALGMDKELSKHLFRATGVPTADWLMARAAARRQAVETRLDRRSDRGKGG